MKKTFSKTIYVFLILTIADLYPSIAFCSQTHFPEERDTIQRKSESPFHPRVGLSMTKEKLAISFVNRKQNFFNKEERDFDILSPKSVNIHPNNRKYYVNSLEGGATIVYDLNTHEKQKVIKHKFNSEHETLWSTESGLFPFHHVYSDQNTFVGKPVESTFTHEGRYLWVPYYRRSYDLNAQEPSAMAVIDTEKDEIIRLFETGPLPKMVATSTDGNLLAVTHWGDNTVGIIDISNDSPTEWRYIDLYIIDYQLKLNYSRTEKVDRDRGSGYCLRGTVFTPDNHYLLVGCMGGSGGIAVIDLETRTYLGRITGTMPNLRHLVIDHGYLYGSINEKGFIQRVPLRRFIEAIEEMGDKKTYALNEWESCKVPSGARTLVLSPDGHYAFTSCSFSSCIAVINARDMRLIGTIPSDPYPVGMDISYDGTLLITTSQGNKGGGGNAVDIYKIDYKE